MKLDTMIKLALLGMIVALNMIAGAHTAYIQELERRVDILSLKVEGE